MLSIKQQYETEIKTHNISIDQLNNLLPQYIIEIDISNLFLKELPSQIYNLINLKKLNCSHNSISSIDQNISNLVNLEEFNCSYNDIIELPLQINNLLNLKKI